ncbi:magnesium transporter CorA family protein [Patescibacteria group bacterium]|nr:magnesium transporter CorA family protein [Patescibacteria group bacterium]
MAKIQTLHFKHYKWINITNPGEAEIKYLRENFKFHPLDLEDCIRPTHRTKIDIYPKYSFLVFLFPVYNRKTREIFPAEIDFFISKNYFVTINAGNMPTFVDFFRLLQISEELRGSFDGGSPERLLYEILNKLFLYCLPMLDHLIVDCDNIEKAIFDGHEKKMVSEILIIRRNIIDYRRIMQVHKNNLKKAIDNFKESPLFVLKKTDVYFDNLVDYSKEIWDALEGLKERITTLHQTNESLISFKLNDIMRILTIISVITFPITLIATVFGMNTVHAMPFLNHKYGFWMVVGIMVLIAGGMLTVFKRKRFL